MKFIRSSFLVALLVSGQACANHHEADEAPAVPTGERAALVTVQAEVVNIDYSTRELSVRGPHGNIVTLKAGAEVKRLEEISLGDAINATYMTSLAAELREPTEEELTMPWVVVDEEVRTPQGEVPAGGVARMIRAVCTIEGMNRVTQTVTIEDPRGMYHVIGDIQPETFAMLSLGQSVIITYTEAVALSLEKMTIGQ